MTEEKLSWKQLGLDYASLIPLSICYSLCKGTGQSEEEGYRMVPSILPFSEFYYPILGGK